MTATTGYAWKAHSTHDAVGGNGLYDQYVMDDAASANVIDYGSNAASANFVTVGTGGDFSRSAGKPGFGLAYCLHPASAADFTYISTSGGSPSTLFSGPQVFMSALVSPLPGPDTEMTLVARWHHDQQSQSSFRWYLDSNMVPNFDFYSGGVQAHSAGVAVPAARWTQLAVAYDQVAVRFYMGERLVASVADTLAVPSSNQNLVIGARVRTGTADMPYSGRIAQVIYNKDIILTNRQVRDLARFGTPVAA